MIDADPAPDAAPHGAALSLSHVTKAFGRTSVLSDIALTVAPGERVALLGPSGCGKTTLLRIIAGLERPDTGRVQVSDTVVADPAARVWVPPERRRVGLVFQDYALFPHLDAAANVTFGLRGRPDPAFVTSALDRVGLAGLEARFPHELSGGQQQRLALARALAPSPRLLLLDEPFSSLDTQLRDSVRDEVRALVEDSGTTTILVTHDQTEALAFADRVAVMWRGVIRQVDTPERLYSAPVDLDVARFVGEVNLVTGVVRGDAVETALGLLPGSGAPDAGPCQVLIRPEQLRLAGDDSTAPLAKVVGRTFAGPTTWLTLDLDGADAPLRMQVSGRPTEVANGPVKICVEGPVCWY